MKIEINIEDKELILLLERIKKIMEEENNIDNLSTDQWGGAGPDCCIEQGGSLAMKRIEYLRNKLKPKLEILYHKRLWLGIVRNLFKENPMIKLYRRKIKS